jgi:hypothetical protein
MAACTMVSGLALAGAPPASAYPLFCRDHAEYNAHLQIPAAKGDIYKTACAIGSRLCLPPPVRSAMRKQPRRLPRAVHDTAWMSDCDRNTPTSRSGPVGKR